MPVKVKIHEPEESELIIETEEISRPRMGFVNTNPINLNSHKSNSVGNVTNRWMADLAKGYGVSAIVVRSSMSLYERVEPANWGVIYRMSGASPDGKFYYVRWFTPNLTINPHTKLACLVDDKQYGANDLILIHKATPHGFRVDQLRT